MDAKPTEVVALLEGLVHTIDSHIASEESALIRIERLLDGNGQPGLVREHGTHAAKLAQLEDWKAQLTAERYWVMGLLVTVLLAVVGMIITFLRK